MAPERLVRERARVRRAQTGSLHVEFSTVGGGFANGGLLGSKAMF